MHYYWDIVNGTAFTAMVGLITIQVLQIRRAMRKVTNVEDMQDAAAETVKKLYAEAVADVKKLQDEAQERLDHIRVVDKFLQRVAADAAIKHVLYDIRVHYPWLEYMGDMDVQVGSRRRSWRAQSNEGTTEDE